MTSDENKHPIIIINKLVTKYEGDFIGNLNFRWPKQYLMALLTVNLKIFITFFVTVDIKAITPIIVIIIPIYIIMEIHKSVVKKQIN